MTDKGGTTIYEWNSTNKYLCLKQTISQSTQCIEKGFLSYFCHNKQVLAGGFDGNHFFNARVLL